MDVKNKTLKPCPFCGGKALLQKRSVGIDGSSHTEEWEILCSNCGAKASNGRYRTKFIITADGRLEYIHDGRSEAIEEWNTRKPIDDIVEQLKMESFTATDREFLGKLVSLDDAIEIVKGGAE